MVEYEEKLSRLESLVGNTPMIRLSCAYNGQPVDIYAKYEAWNFTGSIKDRMALCILKNAYQTGNLKPGDIIVEATSGNTGIAFAAMGAFLGHPVHIYMPNWLSEERKQLLRFYGAKLIEISAEEGGFLHCIDIAHTKSKKKGYFGPKQFENSWNVFAHMKSTAPEIDSVLSHHGIEKLDAFVAGTGTGGTIMGIHHYFSPKYDNFTAYPILPDKNEDGGHRIEGIGDSFIPKILDLESLGTILRISDSDAISVARKINKLGLSVGISSGANVFGALFTACNLEKDAVVATVLCDDNKKYLSTDLVSDKVETSSQEIEINNFELLS